MAPKKTTRRSTAPSDNFTEETFRSLKIGSDGKQPTVRHKGLPTKPDLRDRKKVKRSTELQRKNDLLRQNIGMVQQAIDNKRVLNFRMSEFVAAKRRGAVPMELGGPFQKLAEEEIKLSVKDGPTALVDLEDAVVFWYFPRYIGKGLQTLFLDNLNALVKVYPPKLDGKKGDRRSKGKKEAKKAKAGPSGMTTRSQTATLPRGLESGQEQGDIQAGDSIDGNADDSHSDNGDSDSGDSDSGDSDSGDSGMPDWYVSVEGEVTWATGGEAEPGEGDPVQELSDPEDPDALRVRVEEVTSTTGGDKQQASGTEESLRREAIDLKVLPPASYYLSPAWYQTGMEKKRDRRIRTSRQFKEGLRESSSRQLIAFLEGKRLYDAQLEHLTDIIHLSLGQSMRRLRAAMLKVRGPTKVVLENGWTSPFPCFGVGINRTTAKHRDTKGFSCGMDIIGVLGEFSGGLFKLQDLNVEMEWEPGCLGALDGYDLTHEVSEWEGSHRITLLSFCRSSTWRGLKTHPELSRPTVDEVIRNLRSAQAARVEGIQAGKRKHREYVNKQKAEGLEPQSKRLRAVESVQS